MALITPLHRTPPKPSSLLTKPCYSTSRNRNVEYSLRAFPLGGFVGIMISTDDENLLKNRPVLDRSIVVSAGIIANVIFAYVIIFVQVLSVGLPVMAVDGTNLSKTGPDAVSKVVDVVKRNPKSDVLFRIERWNQDFDIRVTPDKNFDGTGNIGVQLSPNVRITKVRPRNIPETFRFAGKEFMELGEVARSNIDGLYQFAALLNVNLAVIIILALPAPDGGTLALIVLEAVRKREEASCRGGRRDHVIRDHACGIHWIVSHRQGHT
ncbi:hypothetical protein IGI04_016466 [Brassica rapa subsp. trilocularis]|uniref:Peptidase M50 domain-containing protein n=1 Tax=Brassica rapa subsp. trilocularis TaxID=1813537 RepID=A0ABQ7MT31_BRACM|nr:hypothetical protein IGI04_016466 [Brassica rapa subsp. trilocularis]